MTTKEFHGSLVRDGWTGPFLHRCSAKKSAIKAA